MSTQKRTGIVETARKYTVIQWGPFKKDLTRFLNPGQCFYMESLTERLEDFGNLKATSDLRIDRIDDELWELKAKGYLLGKTNVRAFFSVIEARREVIMLGAFKKENEDQTPPHRKEKMWNRLHYYLSTVEN